MKKALLTVLAFCLCASLAFAADKKTGLTPADMKSANSSYIVPAPSDVLKALEKTGEHNWSSLLNSVSKNSYPSVHKTALNFGMICADMAVAVKAQDKDKLVAFITKATPYADTLGISKSVTSQADEIKNLANQGNWKMLMTKINGLQSDATQALNDLDSADLITMISIAGWIEGGYVVSSSISKHYKKDSTDMFYQPGLIDYFEKRLAAMKKYADTPEIKVIKTTLAKAKKLVPAKQGGYMTEAQVKELNALLENARNIIAK